MKAKRNIIWVTITLLVIAAIGGYKSQGTIDDLKSQISNSQGDTHNQSLIVHSSVGVQMLETLNKQGLSLLVYQDTTLTAYNHRGVRDLLTLVATQPERLQGAIVADKIIGKAAAALMATGGVVEVHTNIICTPARELLEREGIRVYATQEVPQILNRDKSHMCPIDSQLEGIESIEECVQILQNIPPVI